jgi:hypothetical protein
MQSNFLKQVAYNQRVMEAEDGIAGINCDAPHFLGDMTFVPEEKVIICLNGSEEMKRNEEAIAGQLWMQSGRQMTASNKVFDGMANTRESAVLTAAAEAVVWKHAYELDGPRKGQRVIIYPKDLPQLEAVLNTGDPNIDSADGHPVAYAAILQASQSFENRPIFLKEDSEQVANDPELAKASEWMAIAKQVATGNRVRVLENGPDVMNSDDEEIADMQPDVEPNMYTSEMDPSKGPIKLSQSQVAAQKAAAQALKALPRSQSPMTGSSDDDDPHGSQFIWSSSKGIFRRNTKWIDPNARKTTPASSDTEDQGEMTEDQKRLVKLAKKKAEVPRCLSAGQPVREAKASSPVKGQESPGTNVPKPTETRRRTASRAEGLGLGDGLGSTDTRVDLFYPSKT